jgi:hypothetical protein
LSFGDRERAETRRRAAIYLQSFENWLHDRKSLARALRAASLRDLVRGRAPLNVREELAMARTCQDCGGPILYRGRGRRPDPERCTPCAQEWAAKVKKRT